MSTNSSTSTLKAIVIGTTPDGSEKLANLLQSISGYDKYPIIILSDYSYEVGKIWFVIQNTSIGEFLFLHDSCEIRDKSLFDLVFESDQSVSLSSQPAPFGMYLGKYQRKVLEKMTIPVARNKMDSVSLEQTFNREYAYRCGNYLEVEPGLVNTDIFIEKFGRKNMVLENKYLIKYKATWSRDQLD